VQVPFNLQLNSSGHYWSFVSSWWLSIAIVLLDVLKRNAPEGRTKINMYAMESIYIPSQLSAARGKPAASFETSGLSRSHQYFHTHSLACHWHGRVTLAALALVLFGCSSACSLAAP